MANKSRAFACILYPDNEKHCKIFHKLLDQYPVACILHDKDTIEDRFDQPDQGEKKDHWHCLIYLPHPRHPKGLRKELGFDDGDERFLIMLSNMPGYLRYLIHLDDADKHQYNENEVFGDPNLRLKLHKMIMNDGKDEEVKVKELIDYIDNFEGFLNVNSFSRYCCKSGRWDVYRRSAVIFQHIIREHNEFELRKYRKDVEKGEFFYD